MSGFIYQVMIRLAVMLPAVMITAALVWYALKKFGVMGKAAPFDARDFRTWPLRFLLAEAALYALIFALVVSGLGEGQWSAAVAGGVAAVVAIGVGPLLAARLVR